MAKSRKLPKPKQVVDEEFWTALEERRQAKSEKARASSRPAEEETQPGLTTKRLAERAACWPDVTRIFPQDMHRMPSDTKAWAEAIAKLGPAWKIYPGMEVLDEKPIPDVGDGIDAGRKIFELAARGTFPTQIWRAIERARKALGPWVEGEGPAADSEVGILAFFHQLDRYFDGRDWDPPTLRKPHASASTGKGPKTLREAIKHWVKHSDLAKELHVDGHRWYEKARRKPDRHLVVPPESRIPSGRGRSAWYRLGPLLELFEFGIQKSFGDRSLSEGFKQKIRPPDRKPDSPGR